MKSAFAAVLAILLLAPALHAAELDRKTLPADTKWFIHVDFDALRASELGKTIVKAVLVQQGARDAIENIRTLTGTDVIADVHDITMFNTTFEQGVGVIVLKAKIDKEKLLGVVRRAPDYAKSQHGDVEIHRWTDPNSGKKGVGALLGNDTVVLGQTDAAITKELDLLGGKGDVLAEGQLEGTEAPAPGTLLSAAARGLAEARDLPLESPIVREAKSISLRLIDHAGGTSIRARLVAKSPQVAEQVKSLVKGFRALVQLQNSQEPRAMKLLNAIEVTSDSDTVHVELSAPTGDMIDLVREAVARQGRPIGPAAEPGEPQRKADADREDEERHSENQSGK